MNPEDTTAMSETLMFVVDTLANGGAGRVVAEIASELCRRGHRVYVCTFRSNEVVYMLEEDIVHIDGGAIGHGKKPGFFQQVRFLHRQIRERNVTCVVSFLTVFNNVAILASAFTGARVVVSERNNPANDKNNVRDRILRKLIYRFADGFVFQTEAIRDWFSVSIARRSRIIGNPINPLLPEPFEGMRAKRIVMSGRLEPQKNYPMAISAFARVAAFVPEYILEIFGEGSLKEKLQAQIDELGMADRIFLRGYSRKLFDDIADAGIYLMTSDYEGMSNALMEALGLGIPVITTDHKGGGARSLIVSGENGMLIPIGDANMLEEKLRELIENPELQKKLSSNALNIRRQFAIGKIADEWETILFSS